MRTKLKIDNALSMNNGILFYSKRHKGYFAISTVDEVGNIKTEWTTMKKYKKEKNKHDKSADMKKLLVFILCKLPFATIFVILLEWLMSKESMLGIRFLFLGYASMLLGVFAISTYIERKKTKNPYKFHSAEHMVINAYRKLKRVPTIEEIRQYSRFFNACGTNATTQMVMNFILMFLCTFIRNKMYMIIGMLSGNIIILILLQCGFLNFLQKFTTIIPTDKELDVAIEGMKVWAENEKKEKEKSKFLKLLYWLFPRVFN